MADDLSGAIRYSITPLDFDDIVTVVPYLDGNICNRDANYEETFWDEVYKETSFSEGYLVLETKANPYGVDRFQVATGMRFDIKINDLSTDYQSLPIRQEKYVAGSVSLDVRQGQELIVYKYGVNVSAISGTNDKLTQDCKDYIEIIFNKG